MTGRSLRSFLLIGTSLCLIWSACTQRETSPPQVSPNRVQNQPTGAQQNPAELEDGQWTMPAKNYASTRFSGLDQINSSNVGSLKLAWSFSIGVLRGHEAAPIVAAGTMYVVTPYPNIVYALDLTQPGAPVKWKYEANPASASQGVACCDLVNRGVVYAAGKVFFNTLDDYDVAFPRLNNYGYFVYLIGGILLYVSFLLNTGPDAGWFAYVPLSGPGYSPGKRVDIWAQMISFTEISALCGAVVIIGTVFKMRAPGMSLHRLPLFVWAQLITSFMIIFAMPAVMLASSLLASDRLIDTHFFNPAEGGDAILYQHMFWFFGHPEVYIIFIPALGFISSIVVAFSRRRIFGYTAMVLSLIATAFLGFGLWVHRS